MIVVDHVSKFYGSHCAVRDLNFEIKEGECVGFLGLNGAGKSTTLRMLSCLLLPTSGRIRIRGLDAEDNPHEIRRLIGYLPDTPPVYGEMTVREYLSFAGQLRGMKPLEVAQRLQVVLETAGLTDVINVVISALSHGYKQRVGIAQAIIHNPALLILDEPIQGLDPVQIVEMREMIRGLRGQHTILLSTHILSEIEQTCDRLLMMNEGQIAAEGTEEALAARYGSAGSIELEVRGDRSALVSVLGGVAGLRDIHITETPDHTLKVTLQSDFDARENVSRAVVEGRLGLLSIKRVSGGIESIFLRLSKGNESRAQGDLS